MLMRRSDIRNSQPGTLHATARTILRSVVGGPAVVRAKGAEGRPIGIGVRSLYVGTTASLGLLRESLNQDTGQSQPLEAGLAPVVAQECEVGDDDVNRMD